MSVLKVDFVGVRTDRFSETVALFMDVLRAPVARRTARLVGFRLADDTVVEVYGPADDFHSFFTTGPVVAFRVADFHRTRQAMRKAGVVFTGDVQTADGRSRQHFYAPDGKVLEISGPLAAGG